MMSSIGSELFDRDFVDCSAAADILVREEPDEDEEDEEEEEEDDEGEDDGDSDGYSE